jgi:hypothetical protein
VFTSLSEGLFSVLQVPLEMSRQFERRKNKKNSDHHPDAGQWPEKSVVRDVRITYW